MLPTAEVNCFIFACSHTSSVKKVLTYKTEIHLRRIDGAALKVE